MIPSYKLDQTLAIKPFVIRLNGTQIHRQKFIRKIAEQNAVDKMMAILFRP